MCACISIDMKTYISLSPSMPNIWFRVISKELTFYNYQDLIFHISTILIFTNESFFEIPSQGEH